MSKDGGHSQVEPRDIVDMVFHAVRISRHNMYKQWLFPTIREVPAMGLEGRNGQYKCKAAALLSLSLHSIIIVTT